VDHPHTVVVLGAGASKPYGLPIGRELLSEIKETIRGETSQTLREISQGKFGEDDFRNLLISLERKRPRPSTIDEYLRKAAPRIRELGKVMIARVLLSKEHHAVHTLPGFVDRDWMYDFVGRLKHATPEARSRLGIVTFNYDRILEHRIVVELHADAVQEDRELASADYPLVQIEHVHGALGSVRAHANWCNGYFSEGITQGKIAEAQQSISIVAEQAAEPAFTRARAMIGKAQRVLFMGFGFDSANLQRLGLVESSKAPLRTIAATCHGLEDSVKAETDKCVCRRVEWLSGDCMDALGWLGDPFADIR
jgi:hypothetical protein